MIYADKKNGQFKSNDDKFDLYRLCNIYSYLLQVNIN